VSVTVDASHAARDDRRDAEASAPPELARYSRQMLFERIGEEGQRRLRHANVTLVGCGALGSVLAGTLVRAGIGSLRIIDRDYLELSNLQRQTLFDEHDVAANLPKSEAAARKLRKINSTVEIEPVIADLNPRNVETLAGDADLILDGTDNLETRFLINDVAVKRDLPWVYGACIGAEGLVLAILPRRTPCLRCIWDELPPPGTTPTCDTVGVLAAAVQIVASLQATEAMKILIGREAELNGLMTVDAWAGRVRMLNVQAAFDAGDCPCCKLGRYEYLDGDKLSATTTLCGRNAVQVLPAACPSPSGSEGPADAAAVSAVSSSGPPSPARVDFAAIAARLPKSARAKHNEFMLRFTIDAYRVTLFADGRAIIEGTSDPAVARGVYAKYVGV